MLDAHNGFLDKENNSLNSCEVRGASECSSVCSVVSAVLRDRGSDAWSRVAATQLLGLTTRALDTREEVGEAEADLKITELRPRTHTNSCRAVHLCCALRVARSRELL